MSEQITGRCVAPLLDGVDIDHQKFCSAPAVAEVVVEGLSCRLCAEHAEEFASEQPRRTLDEANDILRAEGALSWIGLTDPELLGCEADEHHLWLVTATENEIRTWAKSVAVDGEE